MKLSVREIQSKEAKNIVDYFLKADADFLKVMGADKSKLPKKDEWIIKLDSEIKKPYQEKEYYYIIWLIDDEPVGHSNINTIAFGNSAVMHLHLWKNDKRRKGLGIEFLSMTIPFYFKYFELQTLICEPKADNIAPNKVLKKLGFKLIRTYDTTPGWINFHQTVNRYEFKKEQLALLKIVPN